MKHRPEQYDWVLVQFNEKGIVPVIVAGQAVNIWSSIHQDWDAKHNPTSPKISDLLPLTSGDMELLDTGVIRTLEKFSGVVDVQKTAPFQHTHSPDIATIHLEQGGEIFKIQVMVQILGASKEEILRKALVVEVGTAGRTTKVRVADPNHGSFAANHPGEKAFEVIDLDGLPQTLWPIHCVQNTLGADFAPGLDRSRWAAIFQKGTDPKVDSYSGLFDNGKRRATGLGDFLKKRGGDQVYVLGLATDYCVKFTALDSLALGFKTTLIEDASKGVDLHPGDVQKAIGEMGQAGVTIKQAADFLN